MFDEVILLDIYPAREQPIEGVTSKLIYDLIESNVKKSMCSRAQIIQEVEKRKNDFEVLVTLGAGDLDNDVPAIAEILKTRLC